MLGHDGRRRIPPSGDLLAFVAHGASAVLGRRTRATALLCGIHQAEDRNPHLAAGDHEVHQLGSVDGGRAQPSPWPVALRGSRSDRFDTPDALNRWVEQGIAPARQIATQYDNDIMGYLGLPTRPVMTRPLCAGPEQARGNGSGSSDEAASLVRADQRQAARLSGLKFLRME